MMIVVLWTYGIVKYVLQPLLSTANIVAQFMFIYTIIKANDEVVKRVVHEFNEIIAAI